MYDIRVEKIKAYRGPNIWALFPVLEIVADIGPYEGVTTDTLVGFTERLVEVLPGLWEHRCSECRRGGFLEHLRRGTSMEHVFEHVILEIQSLADMPVTFGRSEPTNSLGVYLIAIEYKEAESARICVRLAAEIVEKLARGQALGFDLLEELAEVRDVCQDHILGPSTRAIVDAAEKRGIPWLRLDENSLVQLGHGRYARRIRASATSLTPAIASNTASDKDLTKTLISRVGVPVPLGEVVTDEEGAWRAAEAIIARELGVAVVVKPYDGNQGKAVSVNLTTEDQVRQAFTLAMAVSRRVIVEQYLPGDDYRLLVVNGKMVAAALRRPAQVVADGLHTIRELVDMVNADSRRGSGHGAALTRIRLDGAAELTLLKQGLSWESVPAPGEVVLLRDNSNLSTGGTATDVTRRVHPDNATLAVQAAKAVGLDVAGVDLVCMDISLPLAEQRGAVVEVNAAPGLRMHLYPSEGTPRPVGEAIASMLFPRNAPSRVPLLAVTGTNGKTTVTRMIGHVYSTLKKFVGMTTTDGIYFGGILREKGDCSGPQSAEQVLQHPDVEVAVLETARGGIMRAGLGWDRSTVSVVLNVSGDHLGVGGVDTIEQLARVKRVVIESVSRSGYGVLNADDPLVAAMSGYCPGKVIFFGIDRLSETISRHLADGGRAVYLQRSEQGSRNGAVVFAEGAAETTLLKVGDIPATYGGRVMFQAQNALAATAACWGAGVPLDMIRLGLKTFRADDKMAPGRFNLFDVGGYEAIVDYGHNTSAYKAIQAVVKQAESRRSIGVVATPGDRRDIDIRELAAVAAHTFDYIVVYEGSDLRGRQPGEAAGIITATVAGLRPELPTIIIPDETDAIAHAMTIAEPGDLVVLFVAQVEKAIVQVKGKAAEAIEAQTGAAPSLPSSPMDAYVPLSVNTKFD
ncbi:MAG: cyanophycin synthetase [Chloroflexota bacterium]|nr:cyanophycin synthetase [Chloroflexota bacterium]